MIQTSITSNKLYSFISIDNVATKTQIKFMNSKILFLFLNNQQPTKRLVSDKWKLFLKILSKLNKK